MTLCVGAARFSYGHTTVPKQQLVFQVDERGFGILWNVEVEKNKANLLRSIYDRDQNGKLDAKEQRKAGGRILAPLLRNMEVFLDGKVQGLKTEEARISGSPKITVQALTILTPGPEKEDQQNVTLRLKTPTPLTIFVQAMAGWQLKESSLGLIAADGLSLAKPIVVGREINISFGRNENGN